MNRTVRLLNLAVRSLQPSVARVLAADWGIMPERSVYPSREHLDQTMAWLRRAHDAGGDGVSAGYAVWQGWLPPYPETTGYIIPTFFDYADLSGLEEFRARAVRMADWEIVVQLPDGPVRSGAHANGAAALPAVFNTGQVILGWCRAYRETQDERYLNAGMRAGDWLVEQQDTDGSWSRHSPETKTTAHAYDSRTAWSLLELHQITGRHQYEEAAYRQLDWVLRQQRPNGWFANNSFFPGRHRWNQPFTHTIAYVLEGLLEAWRITRHPPYLNAALRCAERLRDFVDTSGFLPGHFDEGWNWHAEYSCLTGSAQMAGVFLRLFVDRQDESYQLAASRLLGYLKRHHSLTSSHPGIRGGIKGSQPIWGRYTPFVYINWGAKFFADSLMLEQTAARG